MTRPPAPSALEPAQALPALAASWSPGHADHLIVFARVPQLGRVKTRLAKALGEQAALAAHRSLLWHAVAMAGAVAGATRWLSLAGEDAEGECAALAHRHEMRLMHQVDGDLGQRMAAALRHCLEAGAQRVVLMGCDCPPIDARVLCAALRALMTHDSVWGPTEDGGYGLVGLRRPADGLFDAIEWSTPRVMEQTRARLRASGMSAVELPLLWDVDELADWHRWQAWRAQTRGSP